MTPTMGISELISNFHAKDIRWTDEYLSNTPFHSGYWTRVQLDNAIKSHAMHASGILFDVGYGIKPYSDAFAPFVTKHFGLEHSPESGYLGNKADVCGDAVALPIADESVDTVLCTEVMEHLAYPEKAV